MAGGHKGCGFVRTWLIAVRPWAYTASVLAVFLGLGVSYYLGFPIRWGLFVVTLLGVVSFHTAANLLNDCFDHKRKLDAEVNPASGAVVRGLLSERRVFIAGMIFLTLGVCCGFYLVYVAGPVVLLLGLLGAFTVVSYTTSGVCLKSIRLGDLAIFMSFGVLPVFGTFWVQTRTFNWLPIVWSIPLVLYTVGILHANNWRDNQTDPAKGCHTIASWLGDRGSAVYYRFLILAPFVIILLFLAIGLHPAAGLRTPVSVLGGFLALPSALRLVRNSKNKYSKTDSLSFVTLCAQTAKVHLIFASLITGAFFVGRFLSPPG